MSHSVRSSYTYGDTICLETVGKLLAKNDGLARVLVYYVQEAYTKLGKISVGVPELVMASDDLLLISAYWGRRKGSEERVSLTDSLSQDNAVLEKLYSTLVTCMSIAYNNYSPYHYNVTEHYRFVYNVTLVSEMLTTVIYNHQNIIAEKSPQTLETSHHKLAMRHSGNKTQQALCSLLDSSEYAYYYAYKLLEKQLKSADNTSAQACLLPTYALKSNMQLARKAAGLLDENTPTYVKHYVNQCVGIIISRMNSLNRTYASIFVDDKDITSLLNLAGNAHSILDARLRHYIAGQCITTLNTERELDENIRDFVGATGCLHKMYGLYEEINNTKHPYAQSFHHCLSLIRDNIYPQITRGLEEDDKSAYHFHRVRNLITKAIEEMEVIDPNLMIDPEISVHFHTESMQYLSSLACRWNAMNTQHIYTAPSSSLQTDNVVAGCSSLERDRCP
ncbi:HGE-14 family type IV secretion system effector [Anaplasma phagocytophilum]|uniref:HGE-14 family type IV secretion system effector n=1 Tax=Anaplasma phagocytophilum TaxID=948 RepID=UPI00200F0A77|nr:hypothetical protein [Anaplasma phagocytophilum]UQD53933.1 hypothetical protein ESP60_00250 [Anaplasma phagocytophilum]